MLDSIWTEQQGQEVIYQWVEWLHSSSLSHLGFDEEIRLGPYGTNRVADARVVSGIGCIDADIPFLQSYNNERRHQNFLKELHECCICYSEYPGNFQFMLDLVYSVQLFKIIGDFYYFYFGDFTTKSSFSYSPSKQNSFFE
jgi:hypothetical protein